jgi:AAA+ superfamily predicted ATPase
MAVSSSRPGGSPPSGPQAELEALLASRAALIVIQSKDENRVLELVRAASLKVHRPRGWGVFQWSVTAGLSRMDVDLGGSQKHLSDPQELLKHIKATPIAGIYVLLDFHPYLDSPVIVRLLKDIVLGYDALARTLVLVSHALQLPPELAHLSAELQITLPSAQERRAIVEDVIREWNEARVSRPAQVDPQAFEALVENLRGVSAVDCERLARQAVFNDGALNASDLPVVFSAKHRLLNRGGVLSYEPDTARFAELGGMRRLRDWLLARRSAYDGKGAQLDPPKGVLLLGVQGCGKSLAAKAVAGVFGLPLLRLDVGALYSKWHGESERNLRESLDAAQALAPCVVWVDEIEKALSSGDGDNGTSRRVLGGFLTWLAEQRERIFVVATANDITSLPPELVRKGRFDEIFFVDLPNAQARAEILLIHVKKRGISLSREQLVDLVQQCGGFTGAEGLSFHQAIVAAQYGAYARREEVTAQLIAREMAATRPLSVVMAEQVASLRSWAHDRTVAAD